MLMRIRAAGLCAPGLNDWHSAQAVLRGESAWQPAQDAFRFVPPARLPRNEARRATPLTRLAFAACEDALAGFEQAAPKAIFASCSGDMDVIDSICRALSQEAIGLSPMQFHNSVHNAPAGYWSIASGDRQPSISLSAYQGTVAAGLEEAAMQLSDQPDAEVLLVLYDVASPAPMAQARPVTQPFAAALRLAANGAGASLRLRRVAACDDSPSRGALETLRRANPAAQILPLLSALAAQQSARLYLQAGAASLQLDLDCP